MISIKSEFYLSVAVTKRYECKREDGQKIVGASLQIAPSHVKRSQKNLQTTDKERCQREKELDFLEQENEELENNC